MFVEATFAVFKPNRAEIIPWHPQGAFPGEDIFVEATFAGRKPKRAETNISSPIDIISLKNDTYKILICFQVIQLIRQYRYILQKGAKMYADSYSKQFTGN